MTLLHGAQSISELRPAAGSIACAGSTSRLPTGSAHLLRSNRSVRGAHVVAKAEAKKGVVILPGLGNCKSDYEELAQRLGERNFDVEIANVKRADWLRNAAGLADSAYWKCTLEPRPTVDWYLTKVDTAVKELRARTQSDAPPAAMLSHSAGGWLARVYLSDFGTEGFDRLVSLGSPHNPPPSGAKIVDQTRGILTFCETNYPGAFHGTAASLQISYVTISSKFIKGAGIRGKGTVPQKIAGAGYRQLCGEAECWGDGIVPTHTAHLAGAINIDLEGVYHSPLGASEKRKWYGSEGPLEQWVDFLDRDLAEVSTPDPEPAVTV